MIFFILSKGITSWVKTWKSNGWRLKSGGVIINKEDFQKLDKLNAELEVVWVCFICTIWHLLFCVYNLCVSSMMSQP